MYSKEIRDYCITLREKEMSYQDIADRVSDEYFLSINPETIRLWYQDYNKDNDIEEVENVMYSLYKERVDKKKERVKEKLYNKAIESMVGTNEFMNAVASAIRLWKPKERVEVPQCIEVLDDKTLYIFISDIHYGRTSEQVTHSLVQLLSYLTKKKEEGYNRLQLFDLGDNTEGVSIMHNRQILDNDVYGIKQVLELADILQDFLLDCYYLGYNTSFYGISKGNHDRVTASYNEDVEKVSAIVLYNLLIKGLQNYPISIQYFEDAVGCIKIDGYNFVLHHGDGKWNKSKSSELLRLYGDSNMYNLIISGHWHDRYLESGSKYLRVRVPSINISNTYEKFEFLQQSVPGCFIITGRPEQNECTFLTFNTIEDETRGFCAGTQSDM